MTNVDAAKFVRLDIWLWAARFFKTRSLAKQAIDGGKIDLNDVSGKPSKPVHVGDVLRIVRGDERFEITVTALAEQRGPATVAQQLYQETAASQLAREAQREQQRLAGKGYLRPPSRPDKRSRRLIRRFKDTTD
jgi:ribosome-associated heat shock protein Hsp15